MRRWISKVAVSYCLAQATLCPSTLGQNQPPHPPPRQGAALLKTDIMAVFAHPDDETGMAATLAFYARAHGAVVANIYCTRGEGGGNMVGTHAGAALGVLREVELRDCLANLGIRHCSFLDQLDWAYTESATATLRKWDKEQTLERLVRLVRALRPEIIITMNPAPAPGQHGHHQAAGILATEAFTAAADPKGFPLQLSREGLGLWQPRRLFYGGGGSNQFVASIEVNNPLPDGTTPGQLAGRALVHHRSQAFGNLGDSPWMLRPQRFTLVKSFVATTGIQTNLLSGLPIPVSTNELREVAFAPALPKEDMTIEFNPRPAYSNYRRWLAEQRIEHVASHLRSDLPVVQGETNILRLQITNRLPGTMEGDLTFAGPSDWQIEPQTLRVKAEGNSNIEVSVKVTPRGNTARDADIRATLATRNNQQFETIARLHPLPQVRVPRLKTRPSPGRAGEWNSLPALSIESTNLIQGRTTGPEDSSALFRLAHDGTTLFVDVEVKDETIVTNIAPDDVKGHWRTDSIEICIDPSVGAEDTMGCYKLGIFPSDTSGVIRAARDADANQGPMEETAPGTRLASVPLPGGFRIQAAIPFAEIGLRPNQKRLGFNLIIYDGDRKGAALGENINESRIAWAPRSGVQGRPEDWGRIDLE